MPILRPNRRELLAAASASGLVGPSALAAPATSVSAADTKFIFICNHGGWDSTRVFFDSFGQSGVDMEADAESATAGGITYVTHPKRPSVDAFFEAHHERCLVWRGFVVRSISHDVCSMLSMTGTSSGVVPDWGVALANAQRTGFVCPQLVTGGFSFPADLAMSVTRTGTGKLQKLLTSRGLVSDQATDWTDFGEEALIDDFVRRRIAARQATVTSVLEAAMLDDAALAMEKLDELKGIRFDLDFTTGDTLDEQLDVAVAALGMGVSRVATTGYPDAGPTFAWDTHQDNESIQSELFEGLFASLNQLMSKLARWPGTAGGATLADETIVVVLSEMDRTPANNNFSGKDHWPYTAALLIGPNMTTDRVVGGMDDDFFGQPMDLASGEVSDGGEQLSSEHFGATLLALGDVDPGEYVADVIEPMTGVMS